MSQALVLTRSLAQSFAAPPDLTEKDFLAKGEEAWSHAKTQAEKLDAAEWYLRVEPTATGLEKLSIEKRLGEFESLADDEIWLFDLPIIEVSSADSDDPARTTRPFTIKGATYKHGRVATPPANSRSRIVISVPHGMKSIKGSIAVLEVNGRPDTPMTFIIIGDGKQIWKSKPLRDSGSISPFSASISGRKKLELIVDCPGRSWFCQAAWADVKLSGASQR